VIRDEAVTVAVLDAATLAQGQAPACAHGAREHSGGFLVDAEAVGVGRKAGVSQEDGVHVVRSSPAEVQRVLVREAEFAEVFTQKHWTRAGDGWRRTLSATAEEARPGRLAAAAAQPLQPLHAGHGRDGEVDGE